LGIPSTQANPNVGPLVGGTQVQFVPAPLGGGSADGIANSMEGYLELRQRRTTLLVLSFVFEWRKLSDSHDNRPAKNPGPVSVVLTDANNNTVLCRTRLLTVHIFFACNRMRR